MALFDPTRIYDWTAGVNVGVFGGIPTDRTVYQTLDGLDDTGETEVGNEITEALLSCPANQVVVLPETEVGFKFSGLTSYVPNEITLRGAGRGLTTLLWYGGSGGRALPCGSGQTEPEVNGNYSGGTAIVDGMDQFSTVIQVASASGITAGAILVISENNDYTIPFVQPAGGQERLRRQQSLVLSVSGNLVTIREPLMWTLSPSLSPTARVKGNAGLMSYRVGWENFTLDCTPYGGNFSNGALGFWQARECWAKDIYIKQGGANAAIIDDCFRCEFQGYKCDQTGTTSGHTGLIVNRSPFTLITNSEFGALLEINFASGGTVEAFNYYHCANAATFTGISCDANHGGGVQFVLHEGNWMDKLLDDGYHGSGYGGTVFRNVIKGKNDTSSEWEWCVGLMRFTRKYNLVGNILGSNPATPWVRRDNNNLGSEGGITYADSMIYAIGMPNLGGPGSIGYAPPWDEPGEGMPPPGLDWPGRDYYQQVDLDVLATLYKKGNWNGFDEAIHAGESFGADEAEYIATPSLLYPDGQPEWWGDRPWPPFSSLEPESDDPTRIPAGYRFFFEGEDPPPEDTVATPIFNPSAGDYPSPREVEITSITEGATIRYTIDESEPTNSHGTVYSGPVEIDSDTILKAIAYDGVLMDSAVRTGEYSIAPPIVVVNCQKLTCSQLVIG